MTAARVVVEADGGSRGNPGPAGYGALVRDAVTGEVLRERAESIGIATNNVAEYSGLVAGLEAAVALGAVDIEVRMDSKLVIEQMAGRWKIKNPGLRPLAAQAAALLRQFEQVRLQWVPRARNADADRLANAAMDAAAARPSAAAGRAPARVPGSAAAPEAGAGGSVDPTVVAGEGTRLRLILVRHGETPLTRRRAYAGRTDSLLTAHGRAQAAAAARRVAGLAGTPAAVWTSPLARCAATAEVIAAACGRAPVRPEPDLVECDFGDWEGLTYAQVRQRWSALHDRWLAATDVAPPGGEAFTDVQVRVRRAVQRLRQSHPAGTVVLVSHVTPLKLILRDALGATDALLHRLYLEPAGISVIDSWPDGGVAVRTVNDTAHAPPPPAE
ncbi:MAG TPA: bifunctional RNase H/acid phosphatase [Pilimelia sp.]|nr:bifunctional RNase H/acid phosphatase [Pilimelia sp.]